MKLEYITPECKVRDLMLETMLTAVSGGDTGIINSQDENDDVDGDGFIFSN